MLVRSSWRCAGRVAIMTIVVVASLIVELEAFDSSFCCCRQCPVIMNRKHYWEEKTGPFWAYIKEASSRCRSTRRRSLSPLLISAASKDDNDLASSSAPPDSSSTKSLHQGSSLVRPLTQNWWPVSLTSALDLSRPNAITLLDKKLVLWKCTDNNDTSGQNSDSSDSQWSCLDDQCAHRFAPLSEGRVVNQCLQCAYHGWEFNGQGSCTRIPQSTKQIINEEHNQKSIGNVQNYPVREALGMVWVWADPSSSDLANTVSIPISSLMQRFHQAGGTARGYMRDLPYGLEFLGENLLDVSHLPFSHHSVGALNRTDGRPVPLQMLSEHDKKELASTLDGDKATNVLPLFQAKVVDAAQHDPEIVAALRNPIARGQSNASLAQSTVAFFDPCHVRYHRNPGIPGSSYEIQLFMCPTSAGKSRVFLFTPMENQLPPTSVDEGDEKTSNDQSQNNANVAKEYKPSALMQQSARRLFQNRKKATAFPPHFGHMIAHRIFDGDGIFLHKQGDRMRRSGLTYRDYHTPTSSDIVVNAFRRWLDRAAAATRENGGERAATAATGASPSQYLDDQTRADMLDRYTSHTAHCNICLAALKDYERTRDRMRLVTTALIGAIGASGVLAVSSTILLIVARLISGPPPAAVIAVSHAPGARRGILRAAFSILVSSVLTSVGCIVGARKTIQRRKQAEKDIQEFYFEDYVHADKN